MSGRTPERSGVKLQENYHFMSKHTNKKKVFSIFKKIEDFSIKEKFHHKITLF